MFTIGQQVRDKTGDAAGVVIGKRFRDGKPQLRIRGKSTVMWVAEADCAPADVVANAAEKPSPKPAKNPIPNP